METEHKAIDPLVDAIDAAPADRESGPERLADLTDALATGLTTHLRHEESKTPPLIQTIVTKPRRLAVRPGRRPPGRTGRVTDHAVDAGRGERADRRAALSTLPEPARLAYQNKWQPAYAALNLWNDPPPTTRQAQPN
nr:hypothetical protein [Nonomuraea antri]